MAAVKRTEKVNIMYVIACVPSLKGIKWLKMWGVSMAGEGRQVKEKVGDKVQGEGGIVDDWYMLSTLVFSAIL